MRKQSSKWIFEGYYAEWKKKSIFEKFIKLKFSTNLKCTEYNEINEKKGVIKL